MVEDPLFDRIVGITILLEGGCRLTNDPDDPGGATKFGISKAAYPEEDIYHLTVERAKELYFRDYYEPMKCNYIQHFQICFELFDTAVNCGVPTARRIAQRALNYLGAGLDEDGVFGPKTLDSLMFWVRKDPQALFKVLNGEQYIHYRSIKNQKFKYGWMKRIQDYGEIVG